MVPAITTIWAVTSVGIAFASPTNLGQETKPQVVSQQQHTLAQKNSVRKQKASQSLQVVLVSATKSAQNAYAIKFRIKNQDPVKVRVSSPDKRKLCESGVSGLAVSGSTLTIQTRPNTSAQTRVFINANLTSNKVVRKTLRTTAGELVASPSVIILSPKTKPEVSETLPAPDVQNSTHEIVSNHYRLLPKFEVELHRNPPIFGYQVRLADTKEVVCKVGVAEEIYYSACLGTLSQPGWYSFQVRANDTGRWSAWSPSSEKIFIGDVCPTVRWVPMNQETPFVVPFNKEEERVVGYTTLAADGSATSVVSNDPTDSVERMTSGREIGSLPYYLEWARWSESNQDDSTLPSGVIPSLFYVSEGIPYFMKSGLHEDDGYYAYKRWARLAEGPNEGVACKVDASVSLQIIRDMP